MKMFNCIAMSWGEELGILLVLMVVLGVVLAILGYFRDWLISVFKIKDALDKLDDVKRKLEEMDRKLNDIKRQ